MNQFLVSPLVEQQLPSFVRDEYSTFTLFLKKYYEWMEQSGNVLYAANSLRDAQDVDYADDYYIELIRQEFLPYFPTEIQLDKRKFIKLVNQFYKAKGTPLAVQFLFRAIFNEDITITYPKDRILVASDGKWVLPLALRIDTNDENIFNISKCLLTGLTSKATAIVEQVTRSVDRQLGISYIEVYVSNIEKLFTTGETVTSTYNDGTNEITVSGRLIGTLSEIKVDPNNRGTYYNAYDPTIGYDGDPVTIIGGLNPNSENPIGAIAYVGETTKGSITDIIVSNGGFGFRDPRVNTGTSIVDFVGGFTGSVFGSEAKASVSIIDENVQRSMNVSSTTIESLLDVEISTIESNTINTVTTFQTFNVYPISFVTIDGSGGGYRNKPDVEVYSLYLENNDDLLIPGTVNVVKGTSSVTSATVDFTTYLEVGSTVRFFIKNKYERILKVKGVTTTTLTFDVTFENDITGVSIYHVLRSDIRQLGSLGRIAIDDGGDGYQVGEYLIFTDGSGYGANAIITEVHASNSGIKTVEFLQTSNCVIGGEGYTKDSLPTITVDTTSGANASLRVLEITGDGESLNLTTSKIGAISKLRIVSYGYDYVDAPTISLRNADVVVKDVTEGVVFVSNTRIYQGTSNTLSTFSAHVDSFDVNTNLLRIYNYKGSLDPTKILKSDDETISANVVSVFYYGDGRAKATAKFENGLIRLPGLYLNTDGQVSADKVLQDDKKYHNYSYVINTKSDYNKIKTSLQNVIHPIGTKVFVNRIETISQNVGIIDVNYELIETVLPVTFNVSNGANNIVSTSNLYDLTDYISVGDIITVMDVSKLISGTVNVSVGSNTVIGTETNFINDVQDGDVVYIASGNTEIVASVIDANTLWTQNTFGVTATDQNISVVFNDTKFVTFVNANTIFVDTNFTTDSNYVDVMSRVVN